MSKSMSAILSVFFILLTFTQNSLAANDPYTHSLKTPDRRLDGLNFLSGPQHWVGTVAPVEATLPGTLPVTKMHARRRASDGKTEEHWESCDDSCGPGCGQKTDLMLGCKVLNGASDPLLHTWTKSDGGKVSCEYEAWECKAHPKCTTHDRCLIDCKVNQKKSNSACKLACHASAAGFCSSVGGWTKGDPIKGCWKSKIKYSRVIQGSCRDI
ncbi:MAG TPA: hypothetical protein VNJ01_11230 [Bacteriovoracaceae bacterium]|nr:hypothetical protein [Bacteriovoracaceae bacterium]